MGGRANYLLGDLGSLLVGLGAGFLDVNGTLAYCSVLGMRCAAVRWGCRQSFSPADSKAVYVLFLPLRWFVCETSNAKKWISCVGGSAIVV